MNMIPNYLDPYPDELLYSWIHRLAKANGLAARTFIQTYLQDEHTAQVYVNPDIRVVIPALYERIPHDAFPDIKSFVLAFSLLPHSSLTMQDYVVAQYVNNIFQPYTKLNRSINGLIRLVRVCPECLKEDTAAYGEPYLHRAHQLAGVCTCEKHGAWLYRYDRHNRGGGIARGHECDYDLNDFSEITERPSASDAAAYAGYARAVLGAGVVTNFSHVWRTISQRISKRAGSFKTRFEEFFSDYEKWEHAGLHAFNNKNTIITRAHTTGGLRMDEVMPMVMFLFPDPDDLVAALKKRGSVLKEYTCPVCGYEYCTATGNAWICPRCSRDASDEETFALLADALGGGEYELLTPFISIREPVNMRHIPCGCAAGYYPIHFLYRGMRCSCEKPPAGARGSISYRETQDARWMEKFNLYRQYVMETGCSYIPVKMEYRGERLGLWAQRQRKCCKENQLPKDRKAALLEFEPDFFSPEVLKKRKNDVSG